MSQNIVKNATVMLGDNISNRYSRRLFMSWDSNEFFGGVTLVIEEPDRKLDREGQFQVDEDTIKLVGSVSRLESMFGPVVFQYGQRQYEVKQQMIDQITSLWVPISSIGIPALTGLAGAWLQAKYGRKVRLKRGDVEVEAASVDEIAKLLAIKDLLASLEDEAINKVYRDVQLIQKTESPEEEVVRLKLRLMKGIANLESFQEDVLSIISNKSSVEEIREFIETLKL
jgi:hypothetical protein